MKTSILTASLARSVQSKYLALSMLLFVAIPSVMAQNLKLTDSELNTRTISLSAGSTVTISPLNGDILAQPELGTEDWEACQGNGNSGTCQVAIGTSFRVETPTVSQGSNLNFSWDARGAWSCSGTLENSSGAAVTATTWDDNSTKLPRGSQGVGTGSLDPGDYTAFLNCVNGPTSDQSSVPFSISDPSPDVPQFCLDEGRVPPPGMTRDTAILWSLGAPSVELSTETRTWQQTFNGEFPQGNDRNTEVRRDQYAALLFNTGTASINQTGRVVFNNPQFTQTLDVGQKIVTISQCPGDFGPQVDPDCRRVIINEGLRWEVNTNGAFTCKLDPNTDYYLNVMFVADPTASPLEWECVIPPNAPDSRCGTTIDVFVD
ncbi:MAG: hypothetical protein RQ826_17505 [Xanthomonadales bacterium]|nr:hypothetical protein [Xanthomonadales bacterium]